MSCSKPLPPFTYDVLRYLNREQLERFSIVCRPLKTLIERYFHSTPYRMCELSIRGGSYALVHKGVQRRLDRDNNTVQQLFERKCEDIILLILQTLTPSSSNQSKMKVSGLVFLITFALLNISTV